MEFPKTRILRREQQSQQFQIHKEETKTKSLLAIKKSAVHSRDVSVAEGGRSHGQGLMSRKWGRKEVNLQALEELSSEWKVTQGGCQSRTELKNVLFLKWELFKLSYRLQGNKREG